MNELPTLEADEVERYARHLILPEIGGVGQRRLKASRVAVIGAGGLGSPALLYLAAAGVGTLTIIDDDAVSLSNLQRQIIHASGRVGALKTDSATATLQCVNPHVAVRTQNTRIHTDNAAALLDGHDIVVDGCDNFETRYCIADACEALEIPLVAGALGRFDGSLTVLAPHLQWHDGTFAPRYRDAFPAPPPKGTVPSCAEAGILGAVAGVIGTMQAVEVVKWVTGSGDILIGRLLLFDALSMRFQTISYKRRTL